MAGNIQYAQYALAAADAIITAVKRIKGAHDTLLEIQDGARHIRSMLFVTRKIAINLEKRCSSHASTAEEYDEIIKLIKDDISSFEKALSNAFDLKDKDGQLQPVLTISERFKIAMKDGKIQEDRKNLERLEQRLFRSIVTVRTHISELAAETDSNNQASKIADFQNLLNAPDETAEEREERFRVWNSGLDDGDWATEEIFDDAVLSAIRDSVDATNDDPGLQMQTRALASLPSSSSLFGEGWHTHRSSSTHRVDSALNLERLNLSRHAGGPSSSDNQVRNERNESEGETLEALNATFSAAWDDAGSQIAVQNWIQATNALREVIRCGYEREAMYNVPFDDSFQVHEDLAIVYVNQSKWTDALMEITKLRYQSPANHGNDLTIEEKILKSRSRQLSALVRYDRYAKNMQDSGDQHAQTGEGEEDLDQARRSALAAYKILDGLKQSISEHTEAQQQLIECLRILVGIHEALGERYRAVFYRQRLENNSTEFHGPSRRLTNTSMIVPTVSNDVARTASVSTGLREALFACVANSDKAALTREVDSSTSPVDFNIKDDQNCPLLNCAVQKGNAEMVKYLLEHDTSPNCTDDQGETPLLICVRKTYPGIAADLLHHRADIRTQHEDGWTLLHHAVQNPTPEMTTFLLSQAPELAYAQDGSGKTPLHHCADRNGDKAALEHAKVLLEKNANEVVNARIGSSDKGRTPLQLAANWPNLDGRGLMVQLLLDKGAEIDPKARPTWWRQYECLRAPD